MCSSNTVGYDYVCYSGNELRRNGSYVTSCTCNEFYTNYYFSDEEAINDMCYGIVKNYYCSGGTINRNGFYMMNCTCNDGASGNYSSDEEAVSNMCK